MIKKKLLIIGISILMIFLFRGNIYRSTITYTEIGIRPEIEITNEGLIYKVESRSKNKEIDFNSIVEIANQITIEELKFTTKLASSNPNELIDTKEANCIGYAAMFNSIANYMISKNNLDEAIYAEHKIGKLELFGIDLHQYFESRFFKDHDYNIITNIKNQSKISIDPSLSDYLWINRIALDK